MLSIQTRPVSYLILLLLFVSPLHATIELSFYNDIPDTPQETITFASGSLFYTGVLPHIDEFICTSDSPATETVLWFDARGNEVNEGDGSGSSLYWTGSAGNRTLHTSDSQDNELIDVNNQGNNFTCRVDETNEEKYFGIYWVRAILGESGNSIEDLRGMRIYTKDDPPIISEFTLQRGFFNLDFSKQYKVQSLKGSTTITFNPIPTEPTLIPNSSVIDNITFSNSSNCQSIGTSDDDILYTSLFNGHYVSRTDGGISLPEFSESACTGNGTTVELSLGNNSPDLRFTCPLVFNGIFLDIDDLNIDTGSDVIASLPGSSEINKRRIWVNLDNNIRVTLRYDREYVCQDRYGTRSSFRARVDASTELEVYDSDTTVTPAADGTEYITNQTTLYCLSDSNLLQVEWYANTNPNSSETMYTLLSNDTTLQVYASNPRVGRSDLVVIPDPPSDMQGYFYCRDSMGRNLSYSIFSQTPVSPVAIVTPNVTQMDVTIGINRALICGFSNSPHPTHIISYWEDTLSDTLNSNQFLEIDSGVYTCISSNVFGRTSVTINITVIPPAPSEVILLQATEYSTFVDESFDVYCEFATIENVTSLFSITWYHNGTNNLGTGTLTTNGTITGSTLTIDNATFSDSGEYNCIAIVGSSQPSNSTPISITVVVPYAPDVITLSVSAIEYFSAVVSWKGTDRNPPLTETYSIFVSRVGSSEKVNLDPMGSTTLTIPNLIPNNVYEVYVVATNRFFTTQGSYTTFQVSSLRLYFIHTNGDIVPIGAGSIFRGGIQSEILCDVIEFHCFPNNPEQEITWYQPNGTAIPTVTSANSGFYSTRDNNTGESMFYPNNAISYDNEGNNFTCSFMDTSGETIMSSFGIYFAKKERFTSFGNRLYGQDNLIYEFVYQRGVFDFKFTQSYTVECIRSSLPTSNNWLFDPDLLSTTNIMTDETILTNVQFDPSGTCQYIQCAPTEEYVTVSNQPFFVQTVTTTTAPTFDDCLEDNHEFTYNFGDSIDIRITCPLVFGAQFLDVTNIRQIQGLYTSSRRLWFDPSTEATFQLDREFVCEDMYGETASFRIIVNGDEEIQVLANTSTNVSIPNNTDLIGAEIPATLLCVTQDNNNAATWYVDSNPNRNTAESVPVTANTTQLPHVISPRNGRSDLILDGTIGDGAEGFYSCVTNPQIQLGIFLEMPVTPIVNITGNPPNIEVIITITALILVCNSTNMPYPNPIYFWTGNMNFTTALLDTSLLLDADTGVYTCTGSNVAGLSVATINITVIPPPPQFDLIQLVTRPVYVTDNFTIQCRFTTLANLISMFSIEWYMDGILVNETPDVSISTSTNASIGTSELTVTNSVLSQEGNYSCRARVGGSGPTDSDNFVFTFDFPPAPIITINPTDPIAEYITQDVNITCLFSTLARFQGNLSISWYQNGTAVNTSGNIQISRMDLNNTTIEGVLTITSLVVDNAGMYQCVAQIFDVLNSEEVSSSINVEVIGPPTPVVRIDSVNPITDYITQDVSITCLVTTLEIFQGALNVSWYQNGTVVDTSGNIGISTMNLNATTTRSVLTITSLVVDNAGMYHCVGQIFAILNSEEAMSNVIIVDVTGPPAPVVTITPADPITEYITQDVTITCLFTTLVQFQDSLSINWYENGTMVNTSGNIQISEMDVNSTTTESILTITSLVVDNAGMYRCVAQILDVLVSEKTMSDVINVLVSGPPTPVVSIDPVNPITDYITQNVNITCMVTTLDIFQGALNVSWYQNGTVVDTSGNIEITRMNLNATATESILTITSLVVENAGTYHCVGQIIALINSEEVNSSVISVDVTGPPTPMITISPVNPNTEYITQNIILTCEFNTLARFQSSLNIEWYQNGSKLITNNTNQNMNHLDDTTTRSEISIVYLVLDNAGEYHCVAQLVGTLNSGLENSSTINIQPTAPPAPALGFEQIYREYNYELFEDFTFHLHCNFTTVDVLLSNLEIVWLRDNTQIPTSTTIQISTVNQGLDTKDSILTIQDAIQGDSGNYSCEGRIGSFNSTRYPDFPIIINSIVEIPDLNVTVSNKDENSVTLSLTPSQVGLEMIGMEFYVVYYRIAGSDDPYQVFYANSSLSITIPDLMSGTEYEYIIQTTNEFGSTNSSSNIVSTNAVEVTPFVYDTIIGVVVGIVILGIIVIVLLILLLCWVRRRSKQAKQLPAVLNQRYARNVQSASSERSLITKNLGVGANYGEGKLSLLDEPEKTSTFKKAAEVQETALMNSEADGAEPLYEDFSYERYNVHISEFSKKVLEYHLANNAEFDRQFSGLRRDFIHDVTTGSNIVNKPKNRFANIIPYEHSRVKMNFTGENYSDYINACYIDGYYKPQSYIAAQGPMPNTVNDFWRLIWEKNIEHIVALTRVMEALKKKCEQYWPELENNSCDYGPIVVTLKRIDRFTSYDIRMLEMKHQEYPDDTRSVIQFHFIVWPDHGVPIFSSSILSFINHTKEFHIPGKQEAPLLIHCSAGVGRTGTFIVLDFFIEHLKESDKINVYKKVAQLREVRCLMVQTKDQFMFIHDAIQDLITCKDTFVSDHEFQPYLENALIRDLKTMTTPFEDKYELIMRTSRIMDPRDTSESSDVANVMKNRYPNFVPFDSHRVTIIPDQDGDKDYINASFVHSYQRHKGFIAAQSPLDFTVYDFWRMITKYRIQLVVMLSELSEDRHEMSAKYWPEEGKEMLVHYLIIKCEKEQVFDDFVRRKIVVSTEQGGINQSIQQIQYKKWKLRELPEIDDILTLYHQFNQVERGLKSKEPVPIVVHCDNGATRTGTFIASINAIQQLELERKVDIFQIVRNLRNSRPCMVPSLDLYIFIFKLIASYIQSYEEKAYANFV